MSLVSLAAGASPFADVYVDANAPNCAAGLGTASSPFCTITEALSAAASGDSIRIAPGTYVENLVVDKDLTLIGTEGQEVTIIDGARSGSVVRINPGVSVRMEGLTVEGGRSVIGAGIDVLGDLRLLNSTVTDNRSPSFSGPGTGGGLSVRDSASATIVNCTISDNCAGYGGGIASFGRLHVTGCTFRGNGAVWGGSAILSFYADGTTQIDSSTCTGPYRVIMIFGGVAPSSITNSTIRGGQAGLVTENGVIRVEGTTITRSLDGWRNSGATAEVRNTIIAANTRTDVAGAFQSLGHNLIGEDQSGWFNAPGDLVGSSSVPIDPRLGPLSDYGGATHTHALLPGSPAIDAGDPTTFQPADQRGYERVGTADIGAYEFGASSGQAISGCVGNINSAGVVGVAAASGPRSVTANSLVLAASSLPQNKVAIFVTSSTPGFIAQPGGSSGNLCLGGAIGRFVGPGQIRNTGLTGSIALALDLERHPTPTGFSPVMAGDTWYYQAWHRDSVSGVPTSNFTAGFQVTFTP